MSKKILVVDDDPTSLKTAESILTTAGYEVKTSADAEEIENLVKDIAPDLIVMDLMMPNVDGNQAVKKLKDNPALKGVPIIFLTALQMRDEERDLEFEVTVDNTSYRTMTKPVDAKALITEIQRLI
ncbi:MAG: response regulator [Candidatus Omnitrophica bacterium]|nr:response regulator [Candidatus Omnitrophota bacterium]